MSTLKATNFQHPSAGAAALVLDASGNSAFAGVPTAPTAASGTNTTQLATTAFVQGAGGLQLITSQTFSAVSSVSVNSCFTSAYENYLIVMSVTNSAGMTSPNGLIRFRTAGSDNTNSVYNSRLYSGSAYGPADTSAGYVWLTQAGGYSDLVLTVTQPQLATYTLSHYSSNAALLLSVHQNRAGTMGFLGTAQFDGFTIYPGDGTFTGKIRVYGYKNS